VKQCSLKGAWLAFLVVLVVVGAPVLAWAAASNLRLEPGQIGIGSFFQGQEIRITAVIPSQAEAVLEVRGPEREEHLVRKGRRWGLWMNAGDLTISGMPSLYFFAATTPALASLPEAPWGYAALENRSRLTGALEPEGEAFFFKQFIALKESEGIYRPGPEKIMAEPGSEGTKKLSKVFWLPPQVAPGSYQVLLSVVTADGTIIQQQQDLQINKIGMPAFVSALAHEQPVLYGITAVIIALLAGFLMGFFFKSKGAH